MTKEDFKAKWTDAEMIKAREEGRTGEYFADLVSTLRTHFTEISDVKVVTMEEKMNILDQVKNIENGQV